MPNYGYSGSARVPSATLVLVFLADAESKFGKRTRDVNVSVNEEQQAIRTEFDAEFKSATIFIQPGIDDNQRKFQLSHETIHLLAPVRPDEVTFLEEGLATHFSLIHSSGVGPGGPDAKKYEHALNMVAKLIGDFGVGVVQNLRSKQNVIISHITTDQVMQTCAGISKELAEELTTKFYK